MQRKKPSHAPPKPPNGHHPHNYNGNKYKNGNDNNKQHRRVQSLLDMGFDENQALKALSLNNE